MKEKYMQKRNELLAKAESLLGEGKIEEAKTARAEIEQLDTDFENATKEMANLAAVKGNPVVVDIVNKSVPVVDPKPVSNAAPLAETKPVNEMETYRNAFAKNMMGMPLAKEEAEVFDRINDDFRNATQTAATHTVLIPETVKAGIWQEIGEQHPIVGDMAMTFVNGDLTIIKETTAGDDAAWYDEATATADSDVGFGELNLTGCELSKAITISWKLKKMSIDSFLAYITTKIAEKMGNALAKGIVEGKGKPGGSDTFKPQPQGIAVAIEAEASTPQVVTYNTTTDLLDYDKMADAMAVIKSGYTNGAAIYAKNTMIWGTLAKMKDGEGRPLFIQDITSGGVGRIFGLVVKEEDGVSADEILIGNVARGYTMNVNENMTMYMEDHIKARQTDYMGYSIVDGAVLTTKAFALIKKS
ncbi:HK97 family phage major capsid protein [Sporomusaceae bacterium BoRhaA]|uniref:phage major capsid protein n=1 Tax=Pelorhabdus rhamnosifermentans TaxID=2772457 RepID=UPI001C05FA86|nr:phage major capsid protein [Pelorhabdus rhamnosifermentans]MBU2703883.1 HK97 family phage major capsid protein [Pelorhabdus rhamnosifermentans]